MPNTIFSAKRDEEGYWVALVLKPENNTPVEETNGGYEDIADLRNVITRKYKDAVFMVTKDFKQAVAQRQVHTPEMLVLMAQYNELLGKDITSYFVYGSVYRPTNTMFYGLEQAVHMQVDKHSTGFYTYIATPEPLDVEAIEHYGLQFISRSA